MKSKTTPGLRVQVEMKPSLIEGCGLFAAASIRARQKLGNLTGDLITQAEGRRRAKRLCRISIVELGSNKALDASKNGNQLKYINHSCAPNTFIRILGTKVEFYALRAIRQGEELTCDYGETHHEGTHPCKCGSANCRRFI
ncbi:MAG: SET domain-containing protein-lysine N-methyltransferase [Acidobacteria bacterium]|nr:MAG: SET domain-containing protein-lysine N-methyltransferase [Acidobacteriota bacterium]